MKFLALVPLLAVTAFAQQTPLSPLIPSGISDGCKNALIGFDADSSLQSCTSSIISATTNYSSGSNSVTADSIKSALDQLSGLSSTCSSSTLRNVLAQFYQNCQQELTGSSPNKDVIALYEVFYALPPFLTAVCSKDDSQNYCAPQIAARVNNGSSSTNSTGNNLLATTTITPNIAAFLDTANHNTQNTRRGETTFHQINETTFSNNYVLFLMLNPDLSADQLCTSCTRTIMQSYITYESSNLYAPAKANSIIFAGQTPLYNAIQSKCGSNFLGGVVQAAGGIGSGVLGKKSGSLPFATLSASLTVALGVATFALASFL